MANKEATLLLKIKTVGEAALKNVSSALAGMAKMAATAFAAVGGALAYSLKQYREEEEAVNSLNQAMVQQGVYTRALSDEYRRQASELQKLTLFGDEQIISAQAVLQSQIGQEKVTKELTKATLDLAQAQGMSLEQAASLVGKTIGTSTNALARQGIEIDANASKSEKLAQVIQGLNDKFGGQAEAAAQGLGSLEQTKNLLSDFAETIGKAAAPFVTYFNKQFQGLIITLNESPTAFQNIVGFIQMFAKSIAVAKSVVEFLGASVGTTFGFIATTINSIAEKGLSGFADFGNNLALLFEEQKTNFLSAKQTLDNDFAAIDEISKTATLDRESKHLEAMSQKRAADIAKQKKEKDELEYFKKLKNQAEIKNTEDFFNMAKTLQSAKSKEIAAIGKAFALTEIAIKTPVAIASSFEFGSKIGGPPLGFAMGAIAAAAMAAQAAQVAGVPLAEGGIVMPRPGGTQATIGEAGQAEAVIPLDRAHEFGLGGGQQVTINFNGPIMGDESQARRFAEALDKELYRMRKENSSLSFEGII